MLEREVDSSLQGTSWVIWGCSGHASVLLDMIEQQQGRVVAFVDELPVPTLRQGVPVLAGCRAWLQWRQSQASALRLFGAAAVGRQGHHRQRIQASLHQQGVDMPTLLHPQASVSPWARVGAGGQVLAMAVVAAKATLGDVCIVNHRAVVDHECVLGAGVFVGPGATLCGCVWVGEDAFIGAGAIVLPRVRIGAGALIGAGAVVTRDVPDHAVVVGNPARLMPRSDTLCPKDHPSGITQP